jgi:diacylglycerol kinase family enzyme
VEPRLRAALGDLEVERTRGSRDAERIAREGVRAGVERLLVAGGDGTLSEVVTGLIAAGLGGEAEIGLLPLGTGGDFARSLGIPVDLDGAIDLLVRGRARAVDAGRVHYRDRSGREASSCFANVTSLGVSGLVDELVNRAPKFLGGTASYLIGTLRGLARYRCQPVTLGSWFGGGMRVAPGARIDDGLLDLVVVPELGRLRLLARLPTLYGGGHLRDPRAVHRRGRVLEADAPPGEVWLDVDGEPLGTLPARIESLPGAVRMIGPPS